MSALELLTYSSHPLGLRPLGNAYLEGAKDFRTQSLGMLACFEDAFLLQFLVEWMDVQSLLCLSATSRSFYALVNAPLVWREKFIRDYGGRMSSGWPGSWRGAYAAAACTDHAKVKAFVACHISLAHVYSDAVFHDFVTASFDPRPFIEHHTSREIRKLLRKRKMATAATDDVPERPRIPDHIDRVDARAFDASKFVTCFAHASWPCILTHATDDWPCHAWNLDYIRDVWADRLFQAEALQVNGRTYVEYAHSAGGGGMPVADLGVVPDTSPFYLFDADVAAGEDDAARGWRVPSLIARYPIGAKGEGDAREADERTRADLFSLLGEIRPDYRWLIAGPARSGSCWHKDPNLTSAWNAVTQGSKYWMLLPPKTVPPGVYVTEDESEVTAPASLSEWMLDFYAETKAKHGRRECGGDGQLIEGVCHAGEVMYIPSGWWHLVINLDDSVALTQNFVSVAELPSVLSFMKYTPEQISGFRAGTSKSSIFDQFVEKLRAYDAEMTDEALARMPKRKSCHAPTQANEGSDWRVRLCCGVTDESKTTCTLSSLVADEELGDTPW